MVVVLFRSRLTEAASGDYASMAAAMREHASSFPGYVDFKSYVSDDGERLSISRWQDHDAVTAWRNDLRHREAQRAGRGQWYEHYQIDVADVVRSTSFTRAKTERGS